MPSLRSTVSSDTWRALLTTFTDIHRELAAELEAGVEMAIEDYEIFLMLFEAGSGGIRPSELAGKRRLTRSSVTRLIDRLERDGFVERLECGEDGRGSVVALTKIGRRRFMQAGRLHLDGIERHVGSRLTDTESAELRRLLAKLGG